MYLINASYILTKDEVLVQSAIVFDKTIRAIGDKGELLQQYPQAKEIVLNEGSVVMPGLINAHVHLEFSSNKTELKYGSFMPWLYSVIANREKLSQLCEDDCMKSAIEGMLRSGTTTIGAISSWGYDLNVCVESAMKVIYFNEVIGSNPAAVDALWADFLDRLRISKEHTSETFTPAVAIHSAYSVHPVLVKKSVEIVKDEGMQLSAHFLESQAERDWLDRSEGEFFPFFKDFLNIRKSHTSAKEFLENIEGTQALIVHAGHASPDEVEQIKASQHSFVHCPVSNRLLGNDRLSIEGLNYMSATDGLSSNTSLNLFDELKSALFIHHERDLHQLAKELVSSVTDVAADALKLNRGRIEIGYEADIIVLDTKTSTITPEDLHLHILLQEYDVSHTFINGEIV